MTSLNPIINIKVLIDNLGHYWHVREYRNGMFDVAQITGGIALSPGFTNSEDAFLWFDDMNQERGN